MKGYLAFLTGVACFGAGYFLGFKLTKKKYEKLADIEVDSVKRSFEEHYKVKQLSADPKEEKKEKQVNTKTIEQEVKDENTYVDYSKQYRTPEIDAKMVEESVNIDKPKRIRKKNIRIITPEEFNNSSYVAETIYYYDDGVVADSDGNVIDGYTKLIGDDSLTHFGEFEDEAVYVKNDALQIDYEILLTHSNYYSNHSTSNYIVGEDGEDDKY